MRTADIARKTAETDIALSVCLDGTGSGEIQTGCGFLDHMLTLFARHGRFNLTIRCTGDTAVDDHHTTEDIAICLGQAFRQALGDKRGIRRYADAALPMDEALILAAADISGRGGAYLRTVGTPSRGSPGSRYISGSLPGRTPTISSRARSRLSRAACARRSRSTKPARMRSRRARECWHDRDH